jgi:hypothetical protein
MKRKAEEELVSKANGSSNKRATSDEGIVKSRFRNGLFDDGVVKDYTDSYAKSHP